MHLQYFSDLRRRVGMQLLTYEDMSEWKFPIVLAGANALCDVFTVKKVPLRNFLTYNDVFVCIYAQSRTPVRNLSRNFPLV